MFSLTPLPPGRKAIPTHWVFDLKRDAHGNIIRFKARLVVDGSRQIYGVDFSEVFSPTSHLTTVRLLLALAAANDLEIEMLDVKTAFLHGDLEEDIYVSQPPGFPLGDPSMVCKLNKSLYGLRQAARTWHLRLKTVLEALGLGMMGSDRTLFTGWLAGGRVFVLVYVDDLMMVGSAVSIEAVKSGLSKHFQLGTSLQDMFLGIAISRNRAVRTLTISQHRYITDVLSKFDMLSSHPVATPMNLNWIPGTDSAGDVPFAEVVGSLLYLANATRPDLSHVVGVLTRFMSAPTAGAWQLAKRALRYLKGTTDLGIEYGRYPEGLVGYTDSDFAGESVSCKSTSGVMFLYGGGAVAWSSKLQKVVALSTAEAEYLAACAGARVWLVHVLNEMDCSSGEVPVGVDNNAALALVTQGVQTQRTKHIGVAYHMAREAHASGELTFVAVDTHENCADFMTKALSREVFEKQRAAVGIDGVSPKM